MNLINRDEQDRANQEIEKILEKYDVDEQIIILQDCLSRKGKRVKKQEAKDYQDEFMGKLPGSVKKLFSFGKQEDDENE